MTAKLTKIMKTEIYGEKRQRFPYILEDVCKKCGIKIEQNFHNGGYYLSEPIFNQPTIVHFYCDDCDLEWDIKVIPRISLEIIKE